MTYLGTNGSFLRVGNLLPFLAAFRSVVVVRIGIVLQLLRAWTEENRQYDGEYDAGLRA